MTQTPFKVYQDRFFSLGFKSSEAQALPGRDESSGVFVLLLMQCVRCERSSQAAPRASLLSSPMPMLSNITNVSPCYIFFSGLSSTLAFI